jgi:hypothetical protein
MVYTTNKNIFRLFLTILAAIITCVSLLSVTGCGNRNSYEKQLDKITRPYKFSTFSWETDNLFIKAARAADTDTVLRYFSLVNEADVNKTEMEELRPSVEAAITVQINATLKELGIVTTIGKLSFNVPPVNFRLTKPPHLLAISPRDNITLQNQIMLVNDMTAADAAALEDELTGLNVSALVEDLGGYGAVYPTCVSGRMDMAYTIETAVHEWVHQYLAFHPLGFRYVLDGLGIRKDYDAVSINETIADITGKEIAGIIVATYYPQEESTTTVTESTSSKSDFDYNQAMRDIRRQVDTYLAAGQIDAAEAYMETQRQYLITKGYYIRKLNQAYFAYHGIYADSPTSTDPLGDQLRQLRNQSSSLKDFLKLVRNMTTRGQVIAALK